MRKHPVKLLPRASVLLFLACLPLGLLLTVLIWQSYQQPYLDREEQAGYLIERLAVSESDYIVRNHRYLQDLAKTTELREISNEECSTFLNRMLSFKHDISNLSVAEPDGDVVCSAVPMPARANVVDRDFFQRVLNGKVFVIDSAQTDPVSNKKHLVFALPIHGVGQVGVSRVLFASLSMDQWSLRLGSMALPSGSRVVIVGDDQTIVAHYPPNPRVIGLFADSVGFDVPAVTDSAELRFHQADIDGASHQLQSYRPLLLLNEVSPLILGVSLPMEATQRQANQRLALGVLLFLFSFLALGGLIYLWLRGSFTRPLQRLLDSTQSMGAGDSQPVPKIDGPAEVQALQSRIQEMVDAHRTSESDLQASEARFRLVGETIQEVFWVVTPDWKEVLYVNPAYEYVWQRSVDSLYSQPLSWLASVVQEDRQPVKDYMKAVEQSDYSQIVFPQYRIERRDGTIRWISAKGFPAYDKNGRLTSIVGIAEDVTERKEYEIELTQREAKYRLLVENAGELVVKVDPEGRFLFVSPSYCKAFGKSEHQLLGKAFMPLVHEEDQATTSEVMKGLYYPPFKVYLEQRAMTAHGWRWFGWSDTAILDDQQQVTEIIGVGRDITRQKEAEFALRQSESLYRELVDNMSDGVAVYRHIKDTDDFVFTNYNHAAERIAGYTREQVLGKSVDEVFPGIKELGLLDAIRRVAETGEPQRHPLRSYKDERIQLWVENYVFKLPTGEVVAVFRDLTKEQIATEALAQSERKFRGFFEDLSVGLVIADQQGLMQETNKAFCEMFGLDRESLVGASLPELLSAGADSEVSTGLQELLRGARERYRFQSTYKVSAERRLVTNMAIGVLRDEREDRALFYGIAEDVTALELAQAESNRLQRELMRTYRLEALGRLAGGIAHDFNNILGAITGFVELAASRLGEADEETVRGYLEKSEQNSERAKQLIKQLLIFSRGPEYQAAEPQDFNRVVSGSLEMIRSLLPTSITMSLRQAEQQFRVVCDPVQVEQVLLNLCINARDAMEGKGSLQLELDSYHAQNERCVICSKHVEGDWVSLLVQDSGKGISDTEMEHIFEPFFTTKGREKGTGLGLSVVQGIVASYNGHILVERGQQDGTGFRILFPRYHEDATSSEVEPSPEAESDEGMDVSGARVLVVDDEPSMRQLLEEALSSEGYEVYLCRDGVEAWELLQSPSNRFEVLVTDQTMPHLTGLELIEKIRERGDDIPVVLCTGYSDRVNEEVLQALNIAHYLRKPLRLEALRSLLSSLLKERRIIT